MYVLRIMHFCQQARYIITIVFQVVYIQATYRLSQTETPWQTDTCSMATPEIDFEKKPDEYFIINNHLLTPDMTSLWIGYYQVLVGFEYIGCVRKSDIVDLGEVTQQPFNGDPGQCFIGCSNSSIIGVSDTICYCLNETNYNISLADRTGCTRECSTLLKVACGGPNDHLSVYRLNADVTKNESTVAETNSIHPKICLRLNPNDNHYQWDACSSSMPYCMCFNGDNTIEDTSYKNHSKWYNWIYASKRCFDLQLKPVPYLCPLTLPNTLTDTIWTGIFKTNATFKLQDASAGIDFLSVDVKYGMLEYNISGEYHYLHFVKGNAITRKTLCNSDAEDTTPIATNTNTATHSRDDQKPPIIIQTESSIADKYATQSETIPKQPNDTLLISVVCGVCLFVVIAVVVIIIILMKRGACQCCICVKKKPPTAVDNTGNENDTSNQNHAYFITEPHELEQTRNACNAEYDYSDAAMSTITRNEADDSTNKYPDTPFKSTSKYNADDNTYDTTKETQKWRQTGGENIYNNISKNDNTYSTTTLTMQQKFTNQNTDDVYNKLGDESEDTYDSTTSRRQDFTDDIYDKTSPAQDDTYSHTQHTNRVKNVPTDNVYGST